MQNVTYAMWLQKLLAVKENITYLRSPAAWLDVTQMATGAPHRIRTDDGEEGEGKVHSRKGKRNPSHTFASASPPMSCPARVISNDDVPSIFHPCAASVTLPLIAKEGAEYQFYCLPALDDDRRTHCFFFELLPVVDSTIATGRGGVCFIVSLRSGRGF